MGCLKLKYYEQESALGVNANFFGEALEKNAPEPFFCLNAYTYGFNGMERDDEVKGSGNSYDFGARIYDPRIGRWLTLDPLMKKYPSYSPYNFVANMPIVAIDPDGRNIYFVVNMSDPDVDAEQQLANFKKVLNYLNSTEKGKEFLSEYLESDDKNLYFAIGKTSGKDGLGEYIPYKQGEEYGKTPSVEVGSNSYFSDSQDKDSPFNFTIIKNMDGENHYIILDESLFHDEVMETWEAKKGSKVVAHEIDAHANHPELLNKPAHERFGQSGIGHSKSVGEKTAKEVNTQINNLKEKDVTNNLETKEDSRNTYKVIEK